MFLKHVSFVVQLSKHVLPRMTISWFYNVWTVK